MDIEKFQRAIKKIARAEGELNIHISPDFQCDQSLGYPVSLCAAWMQCKAWLVPNEHFLMEEQVIQEVWQGCAEFGIRPCYDAENFNNLLKYLGEDAYDSAYIPPDDLDD